MSFQPLVLSPRLGKLSRQTNLCQGTSKAACKNMYAHTHKHTHTEGQRSPDKTRNLRFIPLFSTLIDLCFQLVKGGYHIVFGALNIFLGPYWHVLKYVECNVAKMSNGFYYIQEFSSNAYIEHILNNTKSLRKSVQCD